ncbi:glycosyltransferase [Acidisoma cellulosilytica]|uniref:Glycosyltransferase n=1 Tax=Acidisoma cellulosilyticum TaxID=2802395 RepID=A0A964E4K5_9PROT|nr:glycosyltransferase [Acidisoma cellulosilyticum]MCB8881579.1 glycosyltransferase [Acidisoma cellulosilyticum]
MAEIDVRYFDAAFYLETYADVRGAGVDPLHHYVSWGVYEGRDPNAFFSNTWYLLQNPDVMESGITALHHYATFGAQEGRDPHPHFDVNFYASQVPEAAEEPLLYHLHVGQALGLPTRRPFSITQAMPSRGVFHEPPAEVAVDIVIPVYRGLEETRNCLRSVLRDRRPGRPGLLHRIVVIDDASPEPELSRYLDRLAARRFIHLLRNPRNRGFVASANRGIKEAGNRDVVLLNADAAVPSGWLSRLAGQAYSHPKVASVSPLSNNATLCSYPGVPGGPLPFGESLEAIDDACAAANAGRAVPVPTTVGFCMYLRRDALNELGVLDAKTFGRGYGEESDYCMRANAAGWRHLLACDLFVYHRGEVSFGEHVPERAANAALLHARWPDYQRRVGLHLRLDEALPFRVATTLQLFATNGLPTVLMVQHIYDGGIGQYIRDLTLRCLGRANVLVVRATTDGRGVALAVPAAADHPEYVIPLPKTEIEDPDLADLAAQDAVLKDVLSLLAPLRIARVHVQHWINLKLDLRALIRALDVPFDVTVHDWFGICPRINLLPMADGPSCGEPAAAVCNRCIQTRDDTAAHDIAGWRAEHAWLFRLADRVLCATEDSIERLAKYGLASRAVLAPLEAMPELVPPCPTAKPEPKPIRARAATRPLRVAVLGVLADHKGAQNVLAVAELASADRLAITLIGKSERGIPEAARAVLSETGAYEADELPALIDRVDPDVIWFPATWPETWSYTLTQAILSGRSILASDIGAFRPRLAGHPRARMIAPDTMPEQVIAALSTLARVSQAPRGRTDDRQAPPAPLRPSYYDGAYQAPLSAPAIRASKSRMPVDLRRDGKLSVVLVPERLDIGVLSGCTYIRGLLPLTHAAAGRDIEVTLASAEEALGLKSDILMAQRFAVPDQESARRLLVHARNSRTPLLYDLDDDLVDLPADHPEAERLRPLAAGIATLLSGVSRVHVSTARLAERLVSLVPGGRAAIDIVPNGLDEELWSLGLGDQGKPEMAALAAAGVQMGPVRILYMGTATHGADLDLILPVLRRLHETFGDRIAVDLVGVTGPGELPSFVNRVVVPRRAGLSYPAFVGWLMERHRREPWAIGLAPLVDTPFNRCKSSIKMLDYAALGLPTVASDMAAYHSGEGLPLAQPLSLEGIEAGGFLAADEAQWYHALAQLIRRPDLRLAMATQGREALLRDGVLAAQAGSRRAGLEAIAASQATWGQASSGNPRPSKAISPPQEQDAESLPVKPTSKRRVLSSGRA